jgi:hypothetical protein
MCHIHIISSSSFIGICLIIQCVLRDFLWYLIRLQCTSINTPFMSSLHVNFIIQSVVVLSFSRQGVARSTNCIHVSSRADS